MNVSGFQCIVINHVLVEYQELYNSYLLLKGETKLPAEFRAIPGKLGSHIPPVCERLLVICPVSQQ